MTDFSQILVPTDFSDNATLAVQYAVDLAGRYRSHLHLLHVIPDAATVIGLYERIGKAVPADWHETMQQHSDERLKKLMHAECGPGDNTVTTTKQGDVFEEITRYAKENKIDLIVIGIQGRTQSMENVIGSLANRVLRKSPCPVLTVPPDKNQFSLP